MLAIPEPGDTAINTRFSLLSRVALPLLISLLPLTSNAREVNVLRSEKAFQISIARDVNGDLLVSFYARDGYALYRDKIKIDSVPRQAIRVTKPAGEIHVDEILGPQALYRGTSIVRVVLSDKNRVSQLEIQSQGCADVGVCYNPRLDLLPVPERRGTRMPNAHAK